MNANKQKKQRKGRRAMLILAIIGGVAILFVALELMWVTVNGGRVIRPTISRSVQRIGQGQPLTYVVMGDSTAIAQGGTYQEGYATATAMYLAKTRQVSWQNVAVSGARARDVLHDQLPKIRTDSPDVVLIAVGANDVTHLTPGSTVVDALRQTIDQLRAKNDEVRIILTGAPDMGSVPRFAQPLRGLAGWRTQKLNMRITTLARTEGVIFAPIAMATGPTFRAHPELFAVDKFHPTSEGYALWTPVLIAALRQAGL